ncbi:glycosyltransferase [Crossiella cryophila]
MPVPGHVGPLLPIARALVERGHRVTWCTGRVFAERITATGAGFAPMNAEHDHLGRSIDELFPERARLRGLAQLRFDMRRIFLDPIPAQVADLRALSTDRSVDALIYDSSYGGAAVLDLLGGPPAISVGTSPLMLPDPDVPPFGPGLAPGTSPLHRFRDQALRFVLDRIVFRPVLAHRDQLHRALGLPAPAARAIGSVSRHLHLQNGVAEFEHPRSTLPPQVKFVGALLDPPPPARLPAWWPELAAARRPIVHVTQGTVADTDLDHLVLPTLRALAEEDVLVVAGTGAHQVPDPPRNALLAPFLPHDRLLPELSAMITNGGFGGVQKALSYGVPLVVAGGSEDKPEVAARVARTGAGINLRTGKPSERAIRAAVRTLLANPGYAASATGLAAGYRAKDAGVTAATLIENLLVGARV